MLATPTAIMAAIGNATKHGFLVREGDALERLAGVKRVGFDKTGTLTYGAPQVCAVQSFQEGLSDEQLYLLTASAELRSEHPLGKAVVRCCRERCAALAADQPIPDPQQFRMIPGRGVQALTEGLSVLAGNRELLEENGAIIPPQALGRAEQLRGEGCTLIFTAVDGRFAGLLALSDQLRESAAETIRSLKQTGVTPVLLTGDHENAARQVAKVLQIDQVHAGCLPEDKLNWIDHSQRQSCPVCMIGDGINDAPALKKAQVGIAMGGIGSDIAVDAADIALINDDIRELPHLVRLSRRMMLTIKCNLTFSMALNFIAIILAITGALNPVVGALVHNAGSVLVIVNSALLLKWRAAKS